MKILLVEDDRKLSDGIRKNLRADGMLSEKVQVLLLPFPGEIN